MLFHGINITVMQGLNLANKKANSNRVQFVSYFFLFFFNFFLDIVSDI